MNIKQNYQRFTPIEQEFPIELMEHLCAVNNIPPSDDALNLIKSVYAETKYRILMEGLNELK